MPGGEMYDAVIVGARCAGAPLAMKLAESGWKVLILDREPPPEDTLSTHFLFPNTIARLAELGVIDRIEGEHTLTPVLHRVRILDHEITGPFTPVDGFDRALSVRRPVLDLALLDSARDAGAETRFGERVVGVVGSGTQDDPVTGVAVDGGDRIESRWVIGADGRASTIASSLGLEKRDPLAGEISFLFAYWEGLPASECMHIDAHRDLILTWGRAEDGSHMLAVAGDAEFTHGSAQERERRYLEALTKFPESFDPSCLDGATRVSEMLVAPEPMMRGFFRQASGPGWALVGDAGHFKHPATAQGISDAIEQAVYVAQGLTDDEHTLEGYEEWRDRRAREHYEWSFDFAHFPRPEVAGPMFAGLESDDRAAQDFRDAWSRQVLPKSGVFTEERRSRWFGTQAAQTR